MARLATSFDVFNALAEPARRRIVELLALAPRAVGDIASALRATQSHVSKHLRVLSLVGLVSCQRQGRSRVYAFNADAVRPMHEWASQFEALWDRQLAAIKEKAEARAKAAGQS